MNDYLKPYYDLFNSITDAMREIDKMNFGSAKEILIKAQQDLEEAFISFGEK